MVYIWGMYLDEKAFIFVLRIITQNKQMKNDVSKLIKKKFNTESWEWCERMLYFL